MAKLGDTFEQLIKEINSNSGGGTATADKLYAIKYVNTATATSSEVLAVANYNKTVFAEYFAAGLGVNELLLWDETNGKYYPLSKIEKDETLTTFYFEMDAGTFFIDYTSTGGVTIYQTVPKKEIDHPITDLGTFDSVEAALPTILMATAGSYVATLIGTSVLVTVTDSINSDGTPIRNVTMLGGSTLTYYDIDMSNYSVSDYSQVNIGEIFSSPSIEQYKGTQNDGLEYRRLYFGDKVPTDFAFFTDSATRDRLGNFVWFYNKAEPHSQIIIDYDDSKGMFLRFTPTNIGGGSVTLYSNPNCSVSNPADVYLPDTDGTLATQEWVAENAGGGSGGEEKVVIEVASLPTSSSTSQSFTITLGEVIKLIENKNPIYVKVGEYYYKFDFEQSYIMPSTDGTMTMYQVTFRYPTGMYISLNQIITNPTDETVLTAWIYYSLYYTGTPKTPAYSSSQYNLGFYYSTGNISSINVTTYLKPGEYAFTATSTTTGMPYTLSGNCRIVLTTKMAYYTPNSTYAPTIKQELFIATDNRSFVRYVTYVSSSSITYGDWIEITPKYEHRVVLTSGSSGEIYFTYIARSAETPTTVTGLISNMINYGNYEVNYPIFNVNGRWGNAGHAIVLKIASTSSFTITYGTTSASSSTVSSFTTISHKAFPI